MPASRSTPPTTTATAAVAGAVDNPGNPACRSATLPTGGASSAAAEAAELGGASADAEVVAGARSGPAAGLGDELRPEDRGGTAAPASSLPDRPEPWSSPASAPDPLASLWPDPDPPEPRPEPGPDPPDPSSPPDPAFPEADPPDPPDPLAPSWPDPDPPDPDPLSPNAWAVGPFGVPWPGVARAGTAPAARVRRVARVREVRRVRTGVVLSEWCWVRPCHRRWAWFVTVTRWTSPSS